MKRGLPKDGASGREARIRRAAAPARSKPSRPASAPRWHQGLLWLLMLASTAMLNPAVRGDDGRELEFVRSVVVDHALPIDHQGAHSTAMAGASLLWSPFFVAAHVGVAIAHSRGSQVPADGRSWPYLWACAFGTACYAFLALSMSYRMALRVAAAPAALLATIAIWLATSLPVYLYALPLTAHAAAMFSAALVLTLWLSIRDGRDARARWFVWGLAAGLAIATSLFNGALVIVALVECATRLARPRAFVQALVNGLAFLAGSVAIVGPGLFIKRQLDGGWITSGNSPVMHWGHPALSALSVSSEHGVFLWTPVVLLAVLGLAVAIRRQPAFAAALLACGGLFFYLVAAYDRPPEASYGSDLLMPITPILVCGLAALVDAVVGDRGRMAWTGATAMASGLILWNLGLMLQWGTGMIPARGPVDFRQVAANQTSVVPRAAKDFVIRYFNDRKGLLSDPGRHARE